MSLRDRGGFAPDEMEDFRALADAAKQEKAEQAAKKKLEKQRKHRREKARRARKRQSVLHKTKGGRHKTKLNMRTALTNKARKGALLSPEQKLAKQERQASLRRLNEMMIAAKRRPTVAPVLPTYEEANKTMALNPKQNVNRPEWSK